MNQRSISSRAGSSQLVRAVECGLGRGQRFVRYWPRSPAWWRSDRSAFQLVRSAAAGATSTVIFFVVFFSLAGSGAPLADLLANGASSVR